MILEGVWYEGRGALLKGAFQAFALATSLVVERNTAEETIRQILLVERACGNCPFPIPEAPIKCPIWTQSS